MVRLESGLGHVSGQMAAETRRFDIVQGSKRAMAGMDEVCWNGVNVTRKDSLAEQSMNWGVIFTRHLTMENNLK